MTYRYCAYKEVFRSTNLRLTSSEQTICTLAITKRGVAEIDAQASFNNLYDNEYPAIGLRLRLYKNSTLLAEAETSIRHYDSSSYDFAQVGIPDVSTEVTTSDTIYLKVLQSSGEGTLIGGNKVSGFNIIIHDRDLNS